MHLVRQMSVEHLSGRGNVHRRCVWSGKCPPGICLAGELSIGDVSGLSGKCPSGKSPSGKCPSMMCPRINPTILQFNVFCWNFAHVFFLPMSTKEWVGFLLFYLDLELFAKIRKDIVFTHSFLILLLITQDLNKIKKSHTFFCDIAFLSRKRVQNY